MDGPKQDGYSNIGCSMHPGEPVHKYCKDCRVLLCFSCVSSDGQRHSQHQDALIPYKTFIKEKEKEAVKMLQRLKELRARAEHFERVITCYKTNFETSHKESEGYLESFDTVKDSMRKWKQELIQELDSKKEEQVKNINDRISQTKEGIITSRSIEVRLPTVTVFLPLQRDMRNKILNLVPRSYTGFSSRGSSERKYGSRTKSSLDDMASLHSITSSVFSPMRPYVSQVSQVSEELSEHTYDEVDSLTSNQTELVALGETAFYKIAKPPPLSLSNIDNYTRNRPKHPTPIKKEDSKKELIIEQAFVSTKSPVPSENMTYRDNPDPDYCSDEENLLSSLPTAVPSIAHDAINTNNESTTESLPMPEERMENSKEDLEEEATSTTSEEEEEEGEREEEEEAEPTQSIPTVAIDGVEINNNEDIPPNDDYDHIESERELPPAHSPQEQETVVPTPRCRRRVDSSPSASGEVLYVSPNDVASPVAKERQYLVLKEAQSQVKSLIPPPLPPPRRGKSIYSTPTVSPIPEYSYPAPHPLAGEDPRAFTESYDTLLPADEAIYDDIEYIHMKDQQQGATDAPSDYARPLGGVPFPESYQPLTHPGQIDDDGSIPYEVPDAQPSPSRSIPATLPREMIIEPEQMIMASCMAESPNETVCLYDLCISSDGYMIFSDKNNCCLRCMLGTSQESKTITKHFKEGLQPHAVTFDNCNHRILMSSRQGLYQVKCSSHFSKMRESRLSKDMIPLSLVCSTIPVAKKKSQSLMYVTLWPSNGESCAYRFDNNGQYESRISSPDISNKKPHGIDYMREYLVVTCLRDGTLAKISHRGDSLWPETVDARRPGILNHPFGVAILPRSEYIAVTEAQGHRVAIFSDKGKLILRMGEKGTDRGKFDTPRGIGVRMAKELVIVDCGNERIQIFSLSSLNLPAFRTSSSVDYQTTHGYTSVGALEATTYYKLPSARY